MTGAWSSAKRRDAGLAFDPPSNWTSMTQSSAETNVSSPASLAPCYHAWSLVVHTAGASSSLYMPLKMETDISDDVVILYCAGRLVFGDETAAFRERINNILLGTQRIVVNLSRVEYIDSGGLGTLVGTLASTRNRHGEIKLVRPNQRVTELLQRTRLNTVFKSYESDDEAVLAFRTRS
jgi:anti-sigma B factor antagonist